MTRQTVWFGIGSCATGDDTPDVELLAPEGRHWGEKLIGGGGGRQRLESQALAWFARSLAGMQPTGIDCEGRYLLFADPDWDSTLRVFYYLPMAVEWRAAFHVPSFLMALVVAVVRSATGGPDETVCELTLQVGVRTYVPPAYDSIPQFSAVWMYNEGWSAGWYKKHVKDGVTCMWGPLDFMAMSMHPYLPHRALLRRPLAGTSQQ